MDEDDAFCGECGSPRSASPISTVVPPPAEVTAPVAAVASPTAVQDEDPTLVTAATVPPPPSYPPPAAAVPGDATEIVTLDGHDRRRKWPWVLAVVVILVAAGGLGAAFALRGDDTSSPVAADVETTQPATTTPPTTRATTTTVADPTRTGMVALDGILTSSASGRASLSSILTAVQPPACSTTPSAAYAQMQTVIDNRTATLRSVQALSAIGSPELVTLRATLIDALEASLASDQSYQRAIDGMYGCEPLRADNPYMVAAAVTDGQATAAKQAFVAAYNPLAGKYGLPIRSADEL